MLVGEIECLHLVCVIVQSFQRAYRRSVVDVALLVLGDWRGSCLYSELIPSVTERLALFVKELSFPQTAPIDHAFSNWNWAGACWNCWAGPLVLDVGLLCKNKKQRGSARTRLLPLRCLSQFFPDEEKINCLESEFSA